MDLLLSNIDVLCSIGCDNSNIGTEREIGDVLHGDSWSIGNDPRDLLIEIFRISDTGDKEIVLEMVNDGWKTLE